ncbi:MAG: cobalt-precorrin-5B (C(1))-methyltransferase CbiD [Methanobrevibacter sp.]|uniref:cobalt-precorrin-5B (C(1))-methyltransferase CbiD n=1 Tax=Methanobrevibacter sp. TaxID=66852 RepID=UPI0026E01ADB|nr:cobalt-precorrin-5B (C(1))-methyltransferase CbiD [Methanobrevibacter sp.]MDO5848310.1 cobalt-precorrin-5B (C(1))-methyltransferase CbiD [Methanobrevibacter sp.]
MTSNNSDFTGPTTGTIATACAIASLKTIFNEEVSAVNVKTPKTTLNILIDNSEKLSSTSAISSAHKRPYNDPDVTVEVEIDAKVELIPFKDEKVIIKGGEGVGTITKPGLQIEIGEAAINPIPRQMIHDNLRDLIPEDKTAIVTIIVPEGKKIAQKTMNPKLGIVDGISILGTTGIARSMSTKAYKDSIVKQLDVVVAQNIEDIIFVPGNIGEKLAIKDFNISLDQIVQTGNFVGFMFEEAKKRGIDSFTFFGHIGKLIKVAGGIFDTKHAVADGRREIMITHAVLCGASNEVAEQLYDSKTTEDMLDILNKEDLSLKVCNSIALAINERCRLKLDLDINVILVDMKGNFLNNNFIQP